MTYLLYFDIISFNLIGKPCWHQPIDSGEGSAITRRSYIRRISVDTFDRIVGIIVLVAIVAFVIGYPMYVYGTGFERTITIAERPPIEGKLVKSTEGDWYTVSDQWLKGVTRSRDTWGNIEIGQTYEVKGYGWRMGILSSYPNILEATPVTVQQQ